MILNCDYLFKWLARIKESTHLSFFMDQSCTSAIIEVHMSDLDLIRETGRIHSEIMILSTDLNSP